MSDGRVHISGIELHTMPGCQERQGRVFTRAVDVGMERAQGGVTLGRRKLCPVPMDIPA